MATTKTRPTWHIYTLYGAGLTLFVVFMPFLELPLRYLSALEVSVMSKGDSMTNLLRAFNLSDWRPTRVLS